LKRNRSSTTAAERGELAYQSELTLSQIARIETMKTNPTVSTIFCITRTLEIPVSELFNFQLPKK